LYEYIKIDLWNLPIQCGWHGSWCGGAPDNVEHIQRLLQELQGDVNTFIPRSYILYAGADSATQVLAQVEYYVVLAT